MRVLISGAGIAGPTLAYWLVHYGMQVTLVEKAPALRTGGYVIDFWGTGFDIAERMGILPEIMSKGYQVREVRVVDRTGKRVAGFPAQAFARAARGSYVSVPRGELAASIFRALEGKVESVFGDSVTYIEQTERRARVTFKSGTVRDFDLVVGADGLHSRVRELVFGAQSRFERYLGTKVAVFEAGGYRPRNELVYVMYTEVGQQVARFAMRDDQTMFMFTFADDASDNSHTGNVCEQKAMLRRRFGDSGWECPQILAALDFADDLYFDRVSQICMDPQPGSWSRDRVTLVGDAASCVSLLAGQGSALAMTAAYILAGEIYRADGDYARAFGRYEALFRPFVESKQKAALAFAGAFAPKSKLALLVRNQVMNLLSVSWIADLVMGKDIADRIVLPNYQAR